MNCIYCGKPIDEHKAGYHTEICVAKALGRQDELDSGVFKVRTELSGYEDELWDYLTADDNPVESVMVFWDRSNYRWAIELNMMCKPGSQEWSHYSVTADTRPLALCRAVLTLDAAEEAEDE